MAATLGYSAPATGAPAAPADPSPTFPPVDNWLPVFDEDFDGTFNGENIQDDENVLEQAGQPDGLDDRVWISYAGDHTPRSLEVADGNLTMRTWTEGGVQKSTRGIATGKNSGAGRGLFEYTYGYAEARIKMVQPVGTTTAFWTYSQDLQQHTGIPLRDPANAGVEIDIVEEWQTAARPNDAQVTHALHWDGYDDAHRQEGVDEMDCPGSPCLGNFHTYGVLWDPSGYRFFIDGQETKFVPVGISHHPEYLILSAGKRATDPGDFGPFGDPRNIQTLVDYVKVWQPAITDIPDQTTQPNAPLAIPFNVSSVVTEETPTGFPGPRVTNLAVGSSNQNVVKDSDIKITGTGADRTITVTPTGTGAATIMLLPQDAAGNNLGVDIFTVDVGGSPAALPTLALNALPDVTTATVNKAIAFTTPTSEGNTPTVTAISSNQYLLPDANIGVTGTGPTRGLTMVPLPTRTGTADITVTARDPADGSTTTDTFRLMATNGGQLQNLGFESGMPPWEIKPGEGDGAVSAAAAHSGAQGFRMNTVGKMTQKIPVEPNTTYVIGGWGRTSAAGGKFELGIWDATTWRPDQSDDNVQHKAVVTFDSTSWTQKDVVFTTGKFTREIEVFANNAFLSNVGFDLDDVYLMAGPELTRIPDQSIGHTHCVAPRFWVGRVGLANDPWTATAAVTGGDTSLITSVAVESSNNPNDPYERRLKITPTSDQTKSGQAIVTITLTGTDGHQRKDDVTVFVNAGSFRNGSFEYGGPESWTVGTQPPLRNTYPGYCAQSQPVWNSVFAHGRASVSGQQTYDWRYGYDNPGLQIADYNGSSGPESGIVMQQVTGLQPNTEYLLSGWLSLQTWPDSNVTLPARGVRMRIGGAGVTFISPASGEVARNSTSWQKLSVRFRTGASGEALVSLEGPDHPTYLGVFHDITLVKAT